MFGQSFWTVTSASSLARLLTTIGIVVISKHERWGKEYSTYIMSLAAGMLIFGPFMHIMPKSLEMTDAASVSTPLGTLASYPFMNRIKPTALGL